MGGGWKVTVAPVPAAQEDVLVITESDKENEVIVAANSIPAVEKKATEHQDSSVEDNVVETKRARHSDGEPQQVEGAAPVVPDWEDLDADDWEDPMMVSEYVVEIFEYLRVLEVCFFRVQLAGWLCVSVNHSPISFPSTYT